MRSPAPEIIAEIERLKMELEGIAHQIQSTETEEQRHELDRHARQIQEQIASLKRGVPN